MTPNHYVKNGSFTKHPFSMDLFASNSVFWTTNTEESCCLLGKEKLECVRGRRSTKNKKKQRITSTKMKKHFTKKHGNKWKKHEKTSHTHKPTPIFIRYPPPETSPSFGFFSTNLHGMNVLFFSDSFKKATIRCPTLKELGTYLKRNTVLFFLNHFFFLENH